MVQTAHKYGITHIYVCSVGDPVDAKSVQPLYSSERAMVCIQSDGKLEFDQLNCQITFSVLHFKEGFLFLLKNEKLNNERIFSCNTINLMTRQYEIQRGFIA